MRLPTIVRRIKYAVLYRNVAFGAGCFVQNASRIAPGTTLGSRSLILGAHVLQNVHCGCECVLERGVRIANSQLGSAITIKHGAAVFGSRLEGDNVVYQQSELTAVNLGRHSYVARDTILNEVEVGRFTSIGPRCLMGTGDHPARWVSTSPVFYSLLGQAGVSFGKENKYPERRKIKIGSDVWVGASVFVRDGVEIGHGAIVGAGAVVVRNVVPYSVVAGVPAKEIRSRCSPTIVAKLLNLSWWNWSEALLREAQPLLAGESFEAFLSWARDAHRESTDSQ